ncbi:MAG: DinB family protein [Crocinitomicaceae bacterium]|nr:DinB family protein [Crocinitomicaceae bacterium]
MIETLTLDQINKIPEGFTGNIAWHLGHMVATHKGLVYQLNGLSGGLDKEFVKKYKKGSVPENPITEEELSFIKKKLLEQVDELEKDLKDEDQWGDTHEYATSFDFTITTLEEAVKFSNIHQAMHVGYILALRRLVTTT